MAQMSLDDPCVVSGIRYPPANEFPREWANDAFCDPTGRSPLIGTRGSRVEKVLLTRKGLDDPPEPRCRRNKRCFPSSIIFTPHRTQSEYCEPLSESLSTSDVDILLRLGSGVNVFRLGCFCFQRGGDTTLLDKNAKPHAKLVLASAEPATYPPALGAAWGLFAGVL